MRNGILEILDNVMNESSPIDLYVTTTSDAWKKFLGGDTSFFARSDTTILPSIPHFIQFLTYFDDA